MEEIYEQNQIIFKNAYDRACNEFKKLFDLKYFDKTNYEKNTEDFQFESIIKDYNADGLKKDLLNEDYVCMLILNKLIFIASTNKEKNRSGFIHEALPITYNEGCRQYLTLKTLYGESLSNYIDSCNIYPESTKEIKKLVAELGEEKVFDGFFSADVRKHADNLNPKELDRWVDTIMVLTNSLEEKMSKESANLLQEREEEYLR